MGGEPHVPAELTCGSSPVSRIPFYNYRKVFQKIKPIMRAKKPQLSGFSTKDRFKLMKTKEKIVQESLSLFNENTFELSTTNLIAKKSEVLEGSLWYHFNSKAGFSIGSYRIIFRFFP